MRAFIAFDLPDTVKSRIQTEIDRSRAVVGDGVRWANPNQTHLTLKFYQDLEDSSVDEVISAIDLTARDTRPVSLTLDLLGAFPNQRRPRVLWLGIGGDVDRLERAYLELEEQLERRGFAREVRPFAAHITIGRVRDNAPPATFNRLSALLRAKREMKQLSFTADEIVLFRSILRPTGPIYEPLHVARLVRG